MRGLICLAVGLSLAAPLAHAAVCAAPSPPPQDARPVKPRPPPSPLCAGVQNCTRVDRDIYDAKVDAYDTAAAAFRLRADAYVEALKAYAQSALAYAQCEARRLDED